LRVVTAGRHDGGSGVGTSSAFAADHAGADDPDHDLDTLLARWARERGGLSEPRSPGPGPLVSPDRHTTGRHAIVEPDEPGPLEGTPPRTPLPNGHGPHAEPTGPNGHAGPDGLGGPNGHATPDGLGGPNGLGGPSGHAAAPVHREPNGHAAPPYDGDGGGWDAGSAPGYDAVPAYDLHASLLAPAGAAPVPPADPWYVESGFLLPPAAVDPDDPGLLTHRATYDPYGAPLDYPPPPPGSIPGRHRRPTGGGRPRWLKVVAVLAAIGSLVAAGVGGWGLYTYKRLSGNITRIDALAPNDPAIKEAAKQRDAENFLLIGSDTRAGANGKYGDVGGARSDTTILAHLSPNRDKALLVSFPRDSWVDLPACRRVDGTTSPAGQGMFNSAFEVGGPRCTVLTVQRLTGISVNHYVQVDFTGFKTMVDALGGVSICSSESVYDRYSGLRLRQGNQVLRGEQALAYVRARKNLGDGSDIGRIQRQQRFLGAMVRKATSNRLLFNPLALTRFLDAATKSLTLDRTTSFGDLKKLADQLRQLDPKKVAFLTAPIANQDYAPPGTGLRGKVLLDGPAGGRLWESIINDKAAPAKSAGRPPGTSAKVTLAAAPADVTVRVLNGVGTAGLARRTAADLTSVGFAIADTGNAGVGATSSVVRYAPNRLDAARTLAAAVPGSVLQADPALGRTLQLVVGSSYRGAQVVQAGQIVPAPPTARATTPTTPTTPTRPVPTINAADAACA
jgi:LCP family protein required for cell wall assembly